jgi:hypothetical protein
MECNLYGDANRESNAESKMESLGDALIKDANGYSIMGQLINCDGVPL